MNDLIFLVTFLLLTNNTALYFQLGCLGKCLWLGKAVFDLAVNFDLRSEPSTFYPTPSQQQQQKLRRIHIRMTKSPRTKSHSQTILPKMTHCCFILDITWAQMPDISWRLKTFAGAQAEPARKKEEKVWPKAPANVISLKSSGNVWYLSFSLPKKTYTKPYFTS